MRTNKAASAERTRPSDGSKASLRVLVLDDDEDTADALAMLLEIRGHTARAVVDGARALATARSFRPEAAVLDIGLPEMDGYEVARRLREEPYGRNMLLIALTGWTDAEHRGRSVDAGFDHHLVKPMELSQLLELFETERRLA